MAYTERVVLNESLYTLMMTQARCKLNPSDKMKIVQDVLEVLVFWKVGVVQGRDIGEGEVVF
jgi:hypothetical protein